MSYANTFITKCNFYPKNTIKYIAILSMLQVLHTNYRIEKIDPKQKILRNRVWKKSQKIRKILFTSKYGYKWYLKNE